MAPLVYNPLDTFPHEGRPEERRAILEGRGRPTRVGRPALSGLPSGYSVARLLGNVAPPREDESRRTVVARWLLAAASFYAGLYATQRPALFVLATDEGRLDVLIGAPVNAAHLKTLCRTAWPGARLEIGTAEQVLARIDAYEAAAAVLGFPADPAPTSDRLTPDRLLDPFVRANVYSRDRWAYAILAHPLTERAIDQTVRATADEMHQLRVEYLHDATSARYDQHAIDYLKALEAYHDRLARGSGEGAWAVAGYVLTSAAQLPALTGSLRAALSGSAMLPEPLHFRPADAPTTGYRANHGEVTFMPSSDLAALAHPPLSESPGYTVQPYRRFSVAVPRMANIAALDLGYVRDLEQPTGETVRLDLTDLTSHMLVAGLTGMGKTNTVWRLLRQLWAEHGIPFLVLEPVKGEYRLLDVADLQVFALGRPGANLAMNPFFFQGLPLHAHIDLLKALFAASYVLYPPMPYILEQSLHEVYADCGWGVRSGLCRREPAGHERSWPTLTALYHKVGLVTERAGYDQRLRSDIQAALQVRIGNLRLGAKGDLLDTRHSLDVGQLLARPTVIDLSAIGDDEQRAFFLGLFLMQVYEFVQARGWDEDVPRLRNVLVIEEAHRLLRNTSREQTADAANPRGRAVETFANLLAEIRAYGIGLVVVEQIPSTLAPEVLKNTGTKIIHRLVDREERTTAAGALNLDETESLQITGLARGEALVLTPQLQRPAHIRVLQTKRRALSAPPTESPAPMVPDVSSALIDVPEARHAVLYLILSGLEGGPAPWQHAWEALRQTIRERSPVYISDQSVLRQMTTEVARHNADEVIAQLGQRYDWRFDLEAALLTGVEAAIDAVSQGDDAELPTELWRAAATRTQPPFLTCCGPCPAICRYRPFVQTYLAGLREEALEHLAIEADPAATAAIYRRAATRLVVGNVVTERGVALCLLIHRADQVASDADERDAWVSATADYL